MLIISVMTVIASAALAFVLNTFYPLSSASIKMCEYVGYISWGSTLGMMGGETWESKTPHEQLNQNLCKLISLLGIAAFVLARELIPID